MGEKYHQKIKINISLNAIQFYLLMELVFLSLELQWISPANRIQKSI